MPLKHLLALNIPDVNNPYSFTISDNSTYADNLQVTCGEVLITPPGFSAPALLQVNPQFNMTLSACDLGMQTIGCGTTTNALPDGVYIVRYAVAPLSEVYVEYNFLRVTNILNQYYTELAALEIAMQDPDETIRLLLAELRQVKSFIDVAKAKVEVQHQPEDGIEVLQYASNRLKKLMGRHR